MKTKAVLVSCAMLAFSVLAFGQAAKSAQSNAKAAPAKRFFSADSFWNRPIPADPQIDPRSARWIELLKQDKERNFGVNATRYTIPVYEVDEKTPTYTVYANSEFFKHGPGFGKDIPIPDDAVSDAQSDAHLALVDWKRMLAWDMWYAKKRDGKWYSNTGMKYRLDGPGVFNRADFHMKTGESVHQYGPGRAAGVPIIAGLIMYDEATSGAIEHKIAAATSFVGLREFCFPAIWTDGPYKGGIPEGAIIQLDPKLDLDKFDLTPVEKAVARALQKYGMVLVDYAGGNVIYAEGLYGKKGLSWDGKLREWSGGIIRIPVENYRVLKVKNSVMDGDGHHGKLEEEFKKCEAGCGPGLKK